MTESDWLACEDPQAMLRHFSTTSTVCHHQVSDRKLLMFSVACGERCGKRNMGESPSSMEPMPWAMRWANPKAPTWIKGPNRITQKEKADFLRDIVGNPFRPVTLPKQQIVCPECQSKGNIRRAEIYASRYDRETCGTCHGDKLIDGPCPWLTPTVLAIAQSAYDERPERECDKGWKQDGSCYRYQKYGTQWEEKHPCSHCHGTGCIDDNSLDPVTLAIMADALEDAGCDNADILMHLRGKQQCNCESNYDAYTRGCDCNGSGWKTMEGHHVRGCHVLDIILVKE